jgi:hypothetical protein
MDRKDASHAIDLFYDQMGWEPGNRIPDGGNLRKFG